ncbi:DUF2247 family protein [Megasphaera massiliensis]|uniref:DUF2247 family protein n=1 Tax=Megasphaera massiliensis TaxID=1232428 RepID=UPI002108AEE5|nr:DUF2247 family protein [Megasphaera massiliensis]MCQ5209259.1 DUF2247 family protein [Megasphaera massiliensis]
MEKFLSIFRENNINISWVSIFVGYILKIINKDDVVLFAERYLSEHKYCNYLISELILNKDDCDEILKKIVEKSFNRIPNENEEVWNFEKQKWRFGLLVKLSSENLKIGDLLYRIADIYAQFGYPSDMKNIIYYSPPTDGYDPIKHTQSQRLPLIEAGACKSEKHRW